VPEGSAEAAGAPEPALRALVDRAVLRVDTVGGARAYLLHDRLLEPLVRLARRPPAAAPPFGPDDQYRAAIDALADGDRARARRWARRAAAAGHDARLRFDALIVLGDIAFAEDDLDAAQDAYERAVTLLETQDTGRDPATVGQVLVAMGHLALRRGDPAAAVGLLRSATAFLPADRTVKTALAKALAEAGEPMAAMSLLGTVMTAAEDDDARMLHNQVTAKLRERPR
jgi:tetratricopeptide (TPR) repeat protein